MNRPEPRKSDLAGLSPITPPSKPPHSLNQASSTEKLTVRVDADIAGRARAAFWATAHLTGTRSLSEWVAEAIADKLQHSEATFNQGNPYTPVPTGTIPTGRRS